MVQRTPELRVALVARDMAVGGNWIVPRFQDRVRLNKPPLMYWLTAPLLAVTGRPASPFWVRLPAALAGACLCVLIYCGGRRLVGRRAAFTAALVPAASAGLLRFARLAETDVTSTLLMTAGMIWLFAALRRPKRWRPWIMAGALCGLGFMVKSPAPLVIPLLTGAAFAAVTRRPWRTFVTGRACAGLAAFALIVVPWHAAVFLLLPAQGPDVVSAEIGTVVAGSRHPEAFYFYLYELPLMLLPWGLLLPPALAALWGRCRGHAGPRFIMAWFLVTFILLSVLSSKQVHYALLFLPPPALMAGWFIARALPHRRGWAAVTARSYGRVVVAALGLCGVVFICAPTMPVGVKAGVLIAAGAVAVLIAAVSLVLPAVRRARMGPALAVVLLMAVLVWGFMAGAYAAVEDDVIIPAFTAAAADRVDAAHAILVTGNGQAVAAFYLAREVAYAEDYQTAWAAARPGDAVMVVERRVRRNLLTENTYPSAPELFMSRGGTACALYRKLAAPANSRRPE